MSGHPDRAFVKYLLDGICHGFRIGYNDDPSRMRRSAKRNMLSAKQNPQVVSDYLKREREAGQVMGPIPSEEVVRVGVHINCFGVIPKSGQPGKWHLIVDLSHPSGESINDGVDPALCSLSYSSVDAAAKIIADLGKGTILAKLDSESAYRNVPVHPEDRPLLGMEWEGQVLLMQHCRLVFVHPPKFLMQWLIHWRGFCRKRVLVHCCTIWMTF